MHYLWFKFLRTYPELGGGLSRKWVTVLRIRLMLIVVTLFVRGIFYACFTSVEYCIVLIEYITLGFILKAFRSMPLLHYCAIG